MKAQRAIVEILRLNAFQKTRTLEFITSIDATKTPFFAMVAPPAPHAPFTAADRHQQLFPDVEALKTKNFNLPCGPLGTSSTNYPIQNHA